MAGRQNLKICSASQAHHYRSHMPGPGVTISPASVLVPQPHVRPRQNLRILLSVASTPFYRSHMPGPGVTISPASVLVPQPHVRPRQNLRILLSVASTPFYRSHMPGPGVDHFSCKCPGSAATCQAPAKFENFAQRRKHTFTGVTCQPPPGADHFPVNQDHKIRILLSVASTPFFTGVTCHPPGLTIFP
jgi:hypothetical protein